MMQHCDMPSGLCVECTTDMDCPMMHVCDVADHTCVDCLTTADCPMDKVCDAPTNRCVAPACVTDGAVAAAPDAGPMMPAPSGGNAIATP